MEDTQKHPGGAPHKFTLELKEKAIAYVSKENFETYQKEIVIKDQIQLLNLERPNWVSVAGLAIELDVARRTIYNWSDKKHASFNQEFLHIFNTLQKKQEFFLEYHGLTRGYDSGFSKFLASNLTKYKEKPDDNQELKSNVVSIQPQDANL